MKQKRWASEIRGEFVSKYGSSCPVAALVALERQTSAKFWIENRGNLYEVADRIETLASAADKAAGDYDAYLDILGIEPGQSFTLADEASRLVDELRAANAAFNRCLSWGDHDRAKETLRAPASHHVPEARSKRPSGSLPLHQKSGVGPLREVRRRRLLGRIRHSSAGSVRVLRLHAAGSRRVGSLPRQPVRRIASEKLDQNKNKPMIRGSRLGAPFSSLSVPVTANPSALSPAARSTSRITRCAR